VPAKDPVVQKAVEPHSQDRADADATYELSLAILFLDKLGDPADEKLIATLAFRLIAGQTSRRRLELSLPQALGCGRAHCLRARWRR
jgi:hypothetical protein